MFKNVLVGIDGGPNGHDALTLAHRLTHSGGKLTLAHVHGGELLPIHALVPGLIAKERESSQRLLEGERAAAGVDAELLSIVAMSAGEGLHEQAERQGADLLVVGSSSRGFLGRAMLGNDTLAALNGAPCAVAIACAGYGANPAPIARIGVAYNSTPESEAALAAARELGGETNASVRALEVVSMATYGFAGMLPPLTPQIIDDMLEQANTQLAALGDVEGRAVYGVPGEELAAFGDELDLLIVGSRGYGPLRRVVLGSTSNRLARRARCSLLVLARASSTLDPAAADERPSPQERGSGVQLHGTG